MYAEFATDPDVQSLAFEDQRHYVILLCLKCNGTLDKDYPSADRRFAVIRRTLGLDNGAVEECKRRLSEAGLIDCHWQPLGWEKRQFISDHNGAERTARWRETKRQRDVTETPSDTDTDTDTEAEKRGDARETRARPLKRCPADFSVTEELREWAAAKFPHIDLTVQTEAFRDHEYRTGKRDWAAAWRGWIRKAAEFNGASKGAGETRRKTRYEQAMEALEHGG